MLRMLSVVRMLRLLSVVLTLRLLSVVLMLGMSLLRMLLALHRMLVLMLRLLGLCTVLAPPMLFLQAVMLMMHFLFEGVDVSVPFAPTPMAFLQSPDYSPRH